MIHLLSSFSSLAVWWHQLGSWPTAMDIFSMQYEWWVDWPKSLSLKYSKEHNSWLLNGVQNVPCTAKITVYLKHIFFYISGKALLKTFYYQLYFLLTVIAEVGVLDLKEPFPSTVSCVTLQKGNETNHWAMSNSGWVIAVEEWLQQFHKYFQFVCYSRS